MLHALRASLALPIVLAGMWAVGMMFYTLAKSLSAEKSEDNRKWKRRYYKWMMTFLATWLLMFILFKFGK